LDMVSADSVRASALPLVKAATAPFQHLP